MKIVSSPAIAPSIELAFQSASSTTGTDFDYLVKTAERESNFKPAAKARTSSATGLFQFIESTWLETLKQAGAKHGLGEYAQDIKQDRNGKYYVADGARKREILDLRKDPEIASLMAGAFTQKNANYLETRLGRAPSDGELYIAHFLGANGASRLIEKAEGNPDVRADKIFPRQARANKSIFYTSSGKARSVSDVYDKLVQRHDAPANTQVAAVISADQAVPVPVAKSLAVATMIEPMPTPAAKPFIGEAEIAFPMAHTEPRSAHGFSFLSEQSVSAAATVVQAVAAQAVAETPKDAAQDFAAKVARADEAFTAVSAAPASVVAQTASLAEALAAKASQVAQAATTDNDPAPSLGVALADKSRDGVQSDRLSSHDLAQFAAVREAIRNQPVAAGETIKSRVLSAAEAIATSRTQTRQQTALAAKAETVRTQSVDRPADAAPVGADDLKTVETAPGGRASRFARLADKPVPVQADYSMQPDARVANAWSAAMPSTPFQALFRTDVAEPPEPISPNYLSSFSAQAAGDTPKSFAMAPEQLAQQLARLTTSQADADVASVLAANGAGSLVDASAQPTVALNEPGGEQEGPMNLLGALRYQIFKEPKDLMPPV